MVPDPLAESVADSPLHNKVLDALIDGAAGVCPVLIETPLLADETPQLFDWVA